jgi:hypothetical protein
MLDYLIASRSLPYSVEQADLGMRWRFSYKLVFNDVDLPLSKKLDLVGVRLGSVLKLAITGTYEDIFQNELKSMWDGSKMYEMSGALRRENELKAAISARGPLTKTRLRDLSNKCFKHV